jgi:hypothetical protein
MGTEIADTSHTSSITPAGLRQRAERVRALARDIAHDSAAQTLRNLADELDAKAAAMEAAVDDSA